MKILYDYSFGMGSELGMLMWKESASGNRVLKLWLVGDSIPYCYYLHST